MKPIKYDFSGWATVYNRRCADGRTILPRAFLDNDGGEVPMIWNHMHNDPSCIMGTAYLEHRDRGVYMYGCFNDNEKSQDVKNCLIHGDIKSISIYANRLQENDRKDVYHGLIREVSLVPAGANPEATIDCVLCHSDTDIPEEAIIYNGEYAEDGDIELYHAESEATSNMAERTIQEVYDEMTEEQKTVVNVLVGMAVEEAGNAGGEDDMKHNVFDYDSYDDGSYLSHSEMMDILDDARSGGGRSLKETALAHGIENLDYLFPDAQAYPGKPIWINDDTTWVGKVMGAVHSTPFSRIKSLFADITADEARARGYIKGKYKKEEVFTLLKRKTEPTTVYKKQSFDRDDIVDVTDFDVAAEVKMEMRGKLNEELARAFLIGDGRNAASDDKINEQNIRPIWKDEDLFTIKAPVVVTETATMEQRVKAFIRACIKSRKNYKGSGNPTLYTTEDIYTEMMLLEDGIGHALYETEEKLRSKLRVKEIVTVPVMENQVRIDDKGNTHELMGIIVNLADYNVGADKGGAVSLFDDFDIDFNKLKYLIETRCSGALVKPFSAIAVEAVVAVMHEVTPTAPTTTRYGKLVSALQEDVFVHDKFIEGTLKYVEGYTGYSDDPAKQEGNYLALDFEMTEGATLTVELLGGQSGPKTVDDGYCVFRITDPKRQKIKVVTTADGNTVSTVYDLRSLVLEAD